MSSGSGTSPPANDEVPPILSREPDEPCELDRGRRASDSLAPIDEHDPVLREAEVAQPEVAVDERLLTLFELLGQHAGALRDR